MPKFLLNPEQQCPAVSLSRARLHVVASAFSLLLLTCGTNTWATDYVSAVPSGNWNSTTTWSPAGVPTISDGVTILAGHFITNNVDTAGARWLTIEAGGGLRLGGTSNPRSFTLAGNFTNNGTLSGYTSGTTSFITNSANGVWIGSGDTSAGKIAIIVKAGVTLDISGLSSPLKYRSAGGSANIVNGTLIAGTQIIDANGNTGCSFTIAPGGTLVSANANGLIDEGGAGTFHFTDGTVTLSTGGNYVFNGDAAQTTAGLPATVNNLTISNSADVSLAGDVTVNGTLALNSGRLLAEANLLSLGASAAVSGAGSSNHVIGSVEKAFASGAGQAFVFPIGDGTVYLPVAVSAMNVVTAGSLRVNSIAIDHPQLWSSGIDASKSVNRYWTLMPADGLAASSYDVLLNFLAGDLDPGADPANFVVESFTGTAWVRPAIGTRTATNASADGLTAFGDLAIGEPAPPQIAKAWSATPTNFQWDTVSLNWTGDSGVFADGDAVRFMDNGSDAAPIELVGTLSPASVTVDASDKNYVFSGTGKISGAGGLVKSGSGTLTIANGANDYSGNTLVNNGTLLVNSAIGSGASTVVVKGDGAVLGGDGVIMDAVTVLDDGTLSPGVMLGSTNEDADASGIGTLTINNNLTLAGQTLMELDKLAGTNDQVVATGNIQYGGTLVVSSHSGTLDGADRFKLFSGASYSGSFAEILPATPGDGFEWDLTSLPVDGTLKVAVLTLSIGSIKRTAPTNAMLSGFGAPSQDYYIWSSTNVASPIESWSLLGWSKATAGGIIDFIDNQATNDQRFYRFGANYRIDSPKKSSVSYAGYKISSQSRFYGYNSVVNRAYPLYDYSVNLLKVGSSYMAITGDRYTGSGEDGDHIMGWTSATGEPNTWSNFKSSGPLFLKSDSFGANTMDPEMIFNPANSTWYLYVQKQAGCCDKIMVLTSTDRKNWTAKTTSVIVNIPGSKDVYCHHPEVIYVPWSNKPFWLYVAIKINGVEQGYKLIKSADPKSFDYNSQIDESGSRNLGSQRGYLLEAKNGPLFVRIATTTVSGASIPI
ncbi:MAG: autotransporter-associated beta strand repeat-containing protein, partial [Verrucomicrobiota bacterium]